MIRTLRIIGLFLFAIVFNDNFAAALEEQLPDAIIYPGEQPGYILVVDKTEQRLFLYRHDNAGGVTLERVMSCSTGKKMGDKMVEGDQKTPNGFYIFNQKLLPSELAPIYGTLAYPTDYPNFWDKSLKRGGHGIWIHGVNKPLINNDSNGCIAVENAEIAQLEDIIRLNNTPLVTYESLAMKPSADLQKESERIRSFIESWRMAWVNKDHETYKMMYSPDFINSDRRSYEAWMAQKETLSLKYETISVEIKNLRIYRHRDVIVAVFEQDYSGGQIFVSVGQKRLYLKEVPDGYQIVAEEFGAIPQRETKKGLSAQQKRLALETPPLTGTQIDEPESARVATEMRVAASDAETIAAENRAIARAKAEDMPITVKPVKNDGPFEGSTAQAVASIAPTTEGTFEATTPRADYEADRINVANINSDDQPFVELASRWATAWARKDMDSYFDLYHPEFTFRGQYDLEGFIEYRKSLILASKNIEVEVRNFSVKKEGDTVKVAFHQRYRSDQMNDTGLKTLFWEETNQGWKIIREAWSPL
mgnify:CR=1 FL=1